MNKDAVRIFFSFLLCGGLAALCNVGSRYIFTLYVSYALSIFGAFIVGMATAFVLFKYVVFRVTSLQDAPKEGVYFVLVNLAALLQTYIISICLAEYIFPWCGWLWHRYDIAHGIGVAVPVFTSYIAHKYFSFGGKKHAAQQLG